MYSVSLACIRSLKSVNKGAVNICCSFTTFQQKVGGDIKQTPPMTKKFKIYRFNPETDTKAHYEDYTVTLEGYFLQLLSILSIVLVICY